jgi:hypothetical protein
MKTPSSKPASPTARIKKLANFLTVTEKFTNPLKQDGTASESSKKFPKLTSLPSEDFSFEVGLILCLTASKRVKLTPADSNLVWQIFCPIDLI